MSQFHAPAVFLYFPASISIPVRSLRRDRFHQANEGSSLTQVQLLRSIDPLRLGLKTKSQFCDSAVLCLLEAHATGSSAQKNEGGGGVVELKIFQQ